MDELLPPPERGLDEEPGEGRGAHRGGFGDASRVAGTFERARDHDADEEVEVNLAEPPKESEPAILWAPTDAPTLAIDDFFSDWERGGEDVFEGYDQEVSEELNLADLAPKTTRGRR